MCGRFAQYRIPWEYLEPLGLRLDTPMAGFVDPEPVNRYNVAPRSRVRILHQDPDGLRWDLVSWGWEPYWAKGTRPPAINARSETATTSKFFKSIWESGRSIVPADWLNQKLSSHDAKPVVTDEAESVGAFEWHPVGREVGNVRNEVSLLLSRYAYEVLRGYFLKRTTNSSGQHSPIVHHNGTFPTRSLISFRQWSMQINFNSLHQRLNIFCEIST